MLFEDGTAVNVTVARQFDPLVPWNAGSIRNVICKRIAIAPEDINIDDGQYIGDNSVGLSTYSDVLSNWKD